MHTAGLVSRVRPVTSGFRPGDNDKRLDFCRQELSLMPRDREETVFVDEKIFFNHDHSSRTMWVRRGADVPLRHRYRWAPHFHCFAAIGVGFRFIIVGIDGRLTSERYQQEVLTPLAASMRAWERTHPKMRIVQDGAPCHRSASTVDWLTRRRMKLVPGWPPRSPFLNPIENLWAIMMRELSSHPDASAADAATFKQMIEEVFAAIPDETIDGLVLSYTRRLQRCVENKGFE